jgi:hypothetical protein
MANHSYEYVTKLATKINPYWSNKLKLLFHYFNPNGLVAQKKTTDEQVRALVDAGTVASGALIAYGGLNYYGRERLTNLAMQKRVGRIDCMVAISCLQDDIVSAQNFIAKHTK